MFKFIVPVSARRKFPSLVVFGQHIDYGNINESIVIIIRHIVAHAIKSLVLEIAGCLVGECSILVVDPQKIVGDKIIRNIDVGPAIIIKI